MTNRRQPAEQPPATPQPALARFDPDSQDMSQPHRHTAHRTTHTNFVSAQMTCACGARRRWSFTSADEWTGGTPLPTTWERAHLEAVRLAVEHTPPLLDLSATVIQDLHRHLLDNPPRGASTQDLAALAWVHSAAWADARRTLADLQADLSEPPPTPGEEGQGDQKSMNTRTIQQRRSQTE